MDIKVALVVVCFGLLACVTKPKGSFSRAEVPASPDYSEKAMWAALPMTYDSADLSAGPALPDLQDSAVVDVFFIHPTTYIGKRGENSWNADLADTELNERTDRTTIKYQATVFNGAGRVFAPRYRQAHLEAFYTEKYVDDAREALKLAYADVSKAFEYYLEEYNDGRPVILAAHSQGSWHGARLLMQYFDGKPLQDRLVAAYLVGMAIEDKFDEIEPCTTPSQTGCICSWRTVKDGFYPKKWYQPGADLILTNPLTWTTSRDYAPEDLNKGAVLKRFDEGPVPNFIDARIDDGFLMVSKPKIPGVPILPMRNYHVADYNFFYVNVRENAQQRVEAYLRQAP